MEKIKLLGHNQKEFSFYALEIEKPQKLFFIAHGVAEDALRYVYFAEKLNKQGYNVYIINHIAHGQDVAIEDLGHWEKGDFDGCIENINIMIDNVSSRFELLPKILFGHSMGSFIVQKYEFLYPHKIDKLILCGCAKPNAMYQSGKIVANILNIFNKKTKRMKIFDKLSFGNFNKHFKPNKTNVDWLSKNEQNCIDYANNPYCGFNCTMGFYKEFYTNVPAIPNKKYNNLFSKDFPILLIGGSEDMVSTCGKLFNKLVDFYKKQSDKVEYKLYEGDRHEILNEDDKDVVIQDIIDFVEK